AKNSRFVAVVVVILTLINRTDKRVAQYLLRPFLYSADYDSTMLIAVKWRENAHRRAIFTFFNGLDAAKLRTVIVITLKRLFAI
ncbi:TPA: hypothetical protein ACISZ2_004437, partial [Salmonella enterica subsp. enterica serovar Isangi]